MDVNFHMSSGRGKVGHHPAAPVMCLSSSGQATHLPATSAHYTDAAPLLQLQYAVGDSSSDPQANTPSRVNNEVLQGVQGMSMPTRHCLGHALPRIVRASCMVNLPLYALLADRARCRKRGLAASGLVFWLHSLWQTCSTTDATRWMKQWNQPNSLPTARRHRKA